MTGPTLTVSGEPMLFVAVVLPGTVLGVKARTWCTLTKCSTAESQGFTLTVKWMLALASRKAAVWYIPSLSLLGQDLASAEILKCQSQAAKNPTP